MRIVYINCLVLFFFLISCERSHGHKVIGDKLTVYFSRAKDEPKAESIAMYWKTNNLLSLENQDLKLDYVQDRYQLKLIARDTSGIKEMPFQERKLLLDLQEDIRNKLFNESLELVICNDNFEIIYNINQ